MSILNATTTSGVVLTGDTTGNLTIQSAGNTVCTITATGANAGIQLASWAAPAFSVYLATASQTISTLTWTKIQLNAKEFDTANAFDATTNYRFQPTIAGYYQINASFNMDSSGYAGYVEISIYKNGSAYKTSGSIFSGGSGGNSPINVAGVPISAVVYLNGSTDYVELYGIGDYPTPLRFDYGSARTFMSGALVRSA